MKDIDKEDLKEKIKYWILDIDKIEELAEDITALNFGLFEPYGIELIGSKIYDKENDDWACEEDFVPKNRTCPNISILEDIDWEIVLETMTEILKEIVYELKDTKLLNVKNITTGFCDGDLVAVK